MSKFERKSKKKVAQIPGTKPALKNSVLLASTGIPSLDNILGGGLPLGSLTVIEEDKYGDYSGIIAKCFTAAGAVSSNYIHFCNLDASSDSFLDTLPSECEGGPSKPNPAYDQDKMKIAWKYANLKPFEEATHRFDFSKPLSADSISDQVSTWEPQSTNTYYDLLKSIQSRLTELKLKSEIPDQEMNLLRIPILSMGSQLWDSDNEESSEPLLRCLTAIRTLLRRSFAIAVITIPGSVTQDPAVRSKIQAIADICIGLESFEGSSKGINEAYKGYDGLFFLHKIAPLNFFIPLQPLSKDWVFKYHKRKFSVEKFHLPPLLSETVSRTSGDKPKATPCSLDF